MIDKCKRVRIKALVIFCCGLLSASYVNGQIETQPQEATLQSVSSVNGDRLLHRPVFQMASSLYGTLTGLNVSLSSGNPGAQLNYSLRNGVPLILVDGVPRSSINVPVEQIESVSVIKDALGTSMMGMMGGAGIVSIVTKKGTGQGLKVSFTSQFAFGEQLFRPKFLQASDDAVLLNEALANDRKPLYYSQNDIDRYKSGAEPFLFPNINWYDYILEASAAVRKYNLNFDGGGKGARYFVDINYFDQDGFVKQDKSVNTYQTQDSWEKYSLRTKVDVDITPATLFEVNVFGQMFRENTPGVALSAIYSTLSTTPAGAYAPVNPDGSLGGNHIYKNNLYGAAIHSGYYLYNSSDLSLDLRLTQDLSGFLKGASISGLYTYNSIYRETLNRSKPRVIYGYSINPDGTDRYSQLTESGTQTNASSYNRQNRLVNFEIDFGYGFTSGKHTSTNKIRYSNINYLIQNNLPFINQNIAGRFQYDYDKRYFAELTTSYAGMNQFKTGRRWGFFPAFGVGWNMTAEDWLKDRSTAFDLLKVRATYGLSGNNLAAAYFESATGTLPYYYDYQRFYSSLSTVYFGNAATGIGSITEEQLPYLTKWATNKQLNIGVDAVLLQNRLTLSAAFFNDNLHDMLQTRHKNNSEIAGAIFPPENIGKRNTKGVDITAGYHELANDFKWTLEGNASIYKTLIVFTDEPQLPYNYMMRTGKPVNQHFGYVADGFFRSEADVRDYLSRMTIEGYNPVAGDLKYRDLNNDNIIDARDIKGIGRSAPAIVYGVYGSASWKGFGVNMQWAGVANRDVMLIDMPFQINSAGGYTPATEQHLNRWTPENQHADYPRLSAGDNSYNQRNSTFWLKDGSFLRLKHIEVFYEFPQRWINPFKLTKAKLFATGYNMLTICALENRDPELINYANQPNLKSLSVGINIQF